MNKILLFIISASLVLSVGDYFCPTHDDIHVIFVFEHPYINFKPLNNNFQDRVVVKHPLRNDKDVGSNPAATRYGKTDIGGRPYRMCPNGPAGSEWKTCDIKGELDL